MTAEFANTSTPFTRTPFTRTPLPVAVIGAGPVGLAMAAHLLERRLDVVIFERDEAVAASQRAWGHVRLFSPWRYNVDRAAASLLADSGWTAPASDGMPTGQELYENYLAPLAAQPAIHSRLHLGHRVEAVTRFGMDKVKTRGRESAPFVIRTRNTDGLREEWHASVVVDASGTWFTPNPLGAFGLPADGEHEASDRISYGVPDVAGTRSSQFAGRSTLVVGAGHSAANSIIALIELAEKHPGTEIAWVTRGSNLDRVFGGGSADGLPARGALGARLRSLVDDGRVTMIDHFRIGAVQRVSDRYDDHYEVHGERHGTRIAVGPFDNIIAATGQRPDLALTRELRLSIDTALESATALAPLIDPNEHSCGTVRPHGARELSHPEPGFYTIGSKSYGRAPTFLLATGYEQARSVAAMIAGDIDAATRVELDLPETGVCSVGAGAGGACCS